MIKVKDLTKRYGELVALDGVSFELKEGEVIGILGPNGAGKTTLLRILVAFLEADSGKVEIDGLDMNQSLLQQKIKGRIGYLPENAPLYEDMTVTEYLMFVGRMQGIEENDIYEKLANVIEKCGLKEKKNAEISTLSKGYRQRVGIAQALIHNPKIVILDEPTTGLDPNQRIEIRDLIKEIGRSKTVILSSHVLSEVQSTCSRVIIINKGKIVADGTPEELENKDGKNKATIHIEVEEIRSNLLPRLEAIKGVDNIEIIESRIIIVSDLENDIRKDIARVIIEEDHGLLELVRKQIDLEDVFIDLTKE
ncbi:MAG: ATP-binding cassette domain-containing protein [Patescibacteria group bacterium]|nr:ATP-binding cassette domain-containing protein [Patescibacteria group bacterium]